MRTLKSKGGFTLVELIVVIAILAILAGVAIPVYNGYIKKAQDAAVITELDAIATAAQAANATVGAIESVDVTVTTAGNTTTTTIEVTGTLAASYDKDFVLFYGEENVEEVTETDPDDEATANDGQFTALSLDLSDTSYKNGATWTAAAGWVKK